MGMVTVRVMRHRDNVRIGRIEIPAMDWELYRAGKHPMFNWPDGTAAAGDYLTIGQRESLKLDEGTTIYLAAA